MNLIKTKEPQAITKAYSEQSQAYKMELFANIINSCSYCLLCLVCSTLDV